MRLFIADGNSANRLALQVYLHQEPGLYITGLASEAKGLPIQVEASRPDVLLIDWDLPGASLEELLSDICALASPPKIIVLSIKPEVKALALTAGADAFISKKGPPDVLVQKIRSVWAADQPWLEVHEQQPLEERGTSQIVERESSPIANSVPTLEDLLRKLGEKKYFRN